MQDSINNKCNSTYIKNYKNLMLYFYKNAMLYRYNAKKMQCYRDEILCRFNAT